MIYSKLGSEDALSASGSDYTPLHNHHQIQHNSQQPTSSECRILQLEKEVAHWRSQYELSKIYADLNFKEVANNSLQSNDATGSTKLRESFNCNCTTTAAGLTTIPALSEGKR